MKLLTADWIVIAAIVMLMGAHFATNFLLFYYSEAAKTMEVAQEAVLLMEANPVAKWFFGFEGLKLVYSFIIAPGMVLGLYYYLRKRYYNDQVVLQSYAVALFGMFSLNFLNDISIVLGVLM